MSTLDRRWTGRCDFGAMPSLLNRIFARFRFCSHPMVDVDEDQEFAGDHHTDSVDQDKRTNGSLGSKASHELMAPQSIATSLFLEKRMGLLAD